MAYYMNGHLHIPGSVKLEGHGEELLLHISFPGVDEHVLVLSKEDTKTFLDYVDDPTQTANQLQISKWGLLFVPTGIRQITIPISGTNSAIILNPNSLKDL